MSKCGIYVPAGYPETQKLRILYALAERMEMNIHTSDRAHYDCFRIATIKAARQHSKDSLFFDVIIYALTNKLPENPTRDIQALVKAYPSAIHTLYIQLPDNKGNLSKDFHDIIATARSAGFKVIHGEEPATAANKKQSLKHQFKSLVHTMVHNELSFPLTSLNLNTIPMQACADLGSFKLCRVPNGKNASAIMTECHTNAVIDITGLEGAMLWALALYKGTPLKIDDLVNIIYGTSLAEDGETIIPSAAKDTDKTIFTVMASKLNQKFLQLGLSAKIHSIWGTGYYVDERDFLLKAPSRIILPPEGVAIRPLKKRKHNPYISL